jgi:hypothetical protein
LGGILSRACLVELFKEDLPYLIPTSFITVSTPHLGVKRSGRGSIFGYIYKFGFDVVASHFLSKTTKELGLKILNSLLVREDVDNILQELCSDEYLEALNKFKHKTLVGLTHGDMLVPFTSSLIRYDNPFLVSTEKEASFQLLGHSGFTQEYKEMLTDKEEDLSLFPTTEKKEMDDSIHELLINVEMLKKLNEIKWRRIAVEFTIPYACRKYFKIEPVIQLHNLGILNVFLDENVYEAKDVESINVKSAEFNEILMKILELDLGC